MQYSINVGQSVAISTEDVFSQVQDIRLRYGFAVFAVWTGASLIGSVVLQASPDGVTYYDISSTSQAVNGPGTFVWNYETANWGFTRVHFIYTSGSGTLQTTITAKEP